MDCLLSNLPLCLILALYVAVGGHVALALRKPYPPPQCSWLLSIITSILWPVAIAVALLLIALDTWEHYRTPKWEQHHHELAIPFYLPKEKMQTTNKTRVINDINRIKAGINITFDCETCTRLNPACPKYHGIRVAKLRDSDVVHMREVARRAQVFPSALLPNCFVNVPELCFGMVCPSYRVLFFEDNNY